MKKNRTKDTITDEQRDTFVAHEDFDDRFFHLMKESKEVDRIIEASVKDCLKKHWMTMAYHLVILSAAVYGIANFFTKTALSA